MQLLKALLREVDLALRLMKVVLCKNDPTTIIPRWLCLLYCSGVTRVTLLVEQLFYFVSLMFKLIRLFD